MNESNKTCRSEKGYLGKIVFFLCIGTSLFHLWVNTFGTMSDLWRNSLHMGLLGAIGYLLYPFFRKKNNRIILVFDALAAGLLLACAFYLIFMEESLFQRNQEMIFTDLLFAGIALVLVMELCRRTTGLFIPIIALFFLSYVCLWGRWVPGLFRFRGLSLDTVLFRMYFTDEGLFGMTATISSTFVFMFVLFASFLLKSGAGDFIISLSQSVTRKITGGPGMVAVVASGLMGTISGSAVANTVSTGSITIPMMKKAGFKPKFSAAVETAASTGGQLMPPIMGAGAFIMAEWTKLPYTTIIMVAFLPAVMYFVSVGVYVFLEAKKLGIKKEKTAGPSPKEIMFDGLPFFIPIGVLVGMLMYGFTPTYSAGYGIIAVIVASGIHKIRKLSLRETGKKLFHEILDSLASGSRNMVITGLLLVTAGIIIGCINMTGISIQFSQMIIKWSGGNLLFALVLITGASLLLGMGLPVTAAYIMLAILAAPALVNMLMTVTPAVQKMLRPEIIQNLLKKPEFLNAVMTSAPECAQKAMMALNDPALIPELIKNPYFVQVVVNSDPGLQTLQAGLLLTAHMIVFWVSQDSNVTPPVCLAAYAGAAIADSPPMATGFEAWKLAKGLYIMPLLFAFTPLIYGGWIEKMQVFSFGIFGLFAFAVAMTGYFFRKLKIWEKLIFTLISLGLFWPLLWLQIFGLVSFFTAGLFVRKYNT